MGRPCARSFSASSGQFLGTWRIFLGARDPELTVEAFGSRWNALKSNFYTFVFMPFLPNLSSRSNPYKSGAREGPALARFPQVLANFWELHAYCWVAGNSKLTAEAFRTRWNALKSKLYTFVPMPFRPKFIFSHKPLSNWRKGRPGAWSFFASSGQFLGP